MINETALKCKLYIDYNYYQKLNETGKALFDKEYRSGLFCSTFPAEINSETDLLDCIIAYCEVTLLALNNRYGITEDTSLSCEIFNLGQAENMFTLLVTIGYPNNPELFHDLMTFEFLKQTEEELIFKLLGDQTIFSLEAITAQHHQMRY